MAAIANLLAKEKGDALTKQAIKQAIVFAVFTNLDQVFLGQSKAAKLCILLSLLRSNGRYM